MCVWRDGGENQFLSFIHSAVEAVAEAEGMAVGFGESSERAPFGRAVLS